MYGDYSVQRICQFLGDFAKRPLAGPKAMYAVGYQWSGTLDAVGRVFNLVVYVNSLKAAPMGVGH